MMGEKLHIIGDQQERCGHLAPVPPDLVLKERRKTVELGDTYGVLRRKLGRGLRLFPRGNKKHDDSDYSHEENRRQGYSFVSPLHLRDWSLASTRPRLAACSVPSTAGSGDSTQKLPKFLRYLCTPNADKISPVIQHTPSGLKTYTGRTRS